MQALLLLVLVLCLATSFLMSGMEAGVFALSRLRIRQQVRAGNRRAKVLHDYLENPEDFLWTILIGNTLANVTIVTIGLLEPYSPLRDLLALFPAALLLFGI